MGPLLCWSKSALHGHGSRRRTRVWLQSRIFLATSWTLETMRSATTGAIMKHVMERSDLSIPLWLKRADERLIRWFRRFGIAFLRAGLAVVFVWFGALKVVGLSPVAELVRDVTPFEAPWLIPLVGVCEIIVGLGLAWGKALRFVLLAFVLQMGTTFLTFLVVPDQMFFDGNLFRLTILGEFVMKNLVLIAAGLAIASTLPTLSKSHSLI